MNSPFNRVLAMFVVTRFALIAVGLLAISRLQPGGDVAGNFHLQPQPNALFEAFARFDACWYVSIAEHGYRAPIGDYADMRPNFFPLYPALVRIVTPLARTPLLAGIIVSNACCLVFLWTLWELVRLDWGERIATRTAWVYLLFPSAFFFSAAYSESTLLAATTSALLAARRQRWALAAFLAAVTVFARLIGVLSILPVVIEYVVERRRQAQPVSCAAIVCLLALPALAVITYLCFAARTFGNPLETFATQAMYRGAISWPWRPFIDLWGNAPRFHTYNNSVVDASLAAVAVTTLPLIYTRTRLSYFCYALLVVLVPLSGSLVSFTRLLLPSFPHAILLSLAISRRTAPVVFAVLGAGEVLAMAAFATWTWVG